MKRQHEEFTKSAFDTLLKRLFPPTAVLWEEVPQSKEPPDWYLQIGSDRYAVEATSIHISTLSGQMSSVRISAALHQFINQIEATAIKEGILTGTYAVSLCPIPDFPTVKEMLRQRLLDYIRDTQSVPSAPRADVWEVGYQSVSIQKLHSAEKSVAEVIFFDFKWECEIQQEISKYLTEMLEKKRAKLARVCEPVILLILDAYEQANTEQWLQAVLEIPSREAFHSICRIWPPNQATILWTVEPRWQSKFA